MTTDTTQTNLRHPHADLIIAWANGAKIEMYSEVEECWWDLDYPQWFDDQLYRIKPEKPKTLKIGEYDVPEPLRVAPIGRRTVYVVDIDATTYHYNFVWDSNSDANLDTLSRGILHLTKESAILHAKALISLSQSNSNANQG